MDPENVNNPEELEIDEKWLRENFDSLTAKQTEQALKLQEQGVTLSRLLTILEKWEATNQPAPEPTPEPTPAPPPPPPPSPEPSPEPTPKKVTFKRRAL